MTDSSDFNDDVEDALEPKFVNWSVKQVYDYKEQIVDYEDLSSLGVATNAARMALFTITEKINKVERQEKAAKMAYDRAYRRAYITSVEKTEAAKRMRAELTCEGLENELVHFEQLKAELNRVGHTLRMELQALQSVGNNLRQQMKIM